MTEICIYESMQENLCKPIHNAEKEHYNFVITYNQHYLYLSNELISFFQETIGIINDAEFRSKIIHFLPSAHGSFFLNLKTSFHSLCACKNLGLTGYPYPAYRLSRDVYDMLVCTSAVLHKITDFDSLEGIIPNVSNNLKSAKKQRKKVEHEVFSQMHGKDSGLSQSTIDTLKEIDELFDNEVHGSRISKAFMMGFLEGKESLCIVPKFEEHAFNLFTTHFLEIGWMFLRLTPALQLSYIPFPMNWKNKWKKLDGHFSETIKSFTNLQGTKTGDAMIEFITSKFPFNEDTIFPHQ